MTFAPRSRPSWRLPTLTTGSLNDAASMMPLEEFQKRIDALIREIHGVPMAEGVDGLMFPGEREWNHRRKAETEGIELPPDVVESLRISSEMTDVRPEWLVERLAQAQFDSG